MRDFTEKERDIINKFEAQIYEKCVEAGAKLGVDIETVAEDLANNSKDTDLILDDYVRHLDTNNGKLTADTKRTILIDRLEFLNKTAKSGEGYKPLNVADDYKDLILDVAEEIVKSITDGEKEVGKEKFMKIGEEGYIHNDTLRLTVNAQAYIQIHELVKKVNLGDKKTATIKSLKTKVDYNNLANIVLTELKKDGDIKPIIEDKEDTVNKVDNTDRLAKSTELLIESINKVMGGSGYKKKDKNLYVEVIDHITKLHGKTKGIDLNVVRNDNGLALIINFGDNVGYVTPYAVVDAIKYRVYVDGTNTFHYGQGNVLKVGESEEDVLFNGLLTNIAKIVVKNIRANTRVKNLRLDLTPQDAERLKRVMILAKENKEILDDLKVEFSLKAQGTEGYIELTVDGGRKYHFNPSGMMLVKEGEMLYKREVPTTTIKDLQGFVSKVSNATRGNKTTIKALLGMDEETFLTVFKLLEKAYDLRVRKLTTI